MKTLCAAVAALTASIAAAEPAAQSVGVGTHELAGTRSGLDVEVMVQGPASQATPLQVACLFEYTEDDLTRAPALPAALNGMLHLDQALHGGITALRKSARFSGFELETLLLQPTAKEISAERVLLVGLGGRAAFTPEVMTRVGLVGMREALRLGVASYSHASDLKDAGVDSPTAAVAQNIIKGALAALQTQQFLQQNGLGSAPSVKKLTLLAGPAFYADTLRAARVAIQTTAEK